MGNQRTEAHNYHLLDNVKAVRVVFSGRWPLDLTSSRLDVRCKFIFMYSNRVQEAHDLSSPGQLQQSHCHLPLCGRH
ncbi:hypothetical protein T02_7536 [Trichinella nativa]|uniref:Uncharacterized protein n=1 Tax=Trichinella nativa TaxID=6335 RepID=A0A0V1KV26_9BILA|nr:hypothetical protein T02_7536 [Trichinella nativa]